MKITDILKKDMILSNLQASEKQGILQELAIVSAPAASLSADEIFNVLMDRERIGSTGLGGGIGIPHGKIKGLQNPVICLGLSRQGADFESMDGLPTHIFFLLLTPENSTGLNLKLLAQISRMLKNGPFKEILLNTSDLDQLYAAIQREDEEF
ncbi:PTS sugar transporter subunit IIA [Desulfococcaceae bacterium HSG9]|nr:PTS sugar transporter subunit IIA [Desulfococcaceae bacterium HSG9]